MDSMWIRVFDHSKGARYSHMCETLLMVACVRSVRSMVSHTCVRHLDSHVKGDKCIRGVEGMRGVGSVSVPHTCEDSSHTCENTLRIKCGLAR